MKNIDAATFEIRKLEMTDSDAAAHVLRSSFDDRLPWLAGLHTPRKIGLSCATICFRPVRSGAPSAPNSSA